MYEDVVNQSMPLKQSKTSVCNRGRLQMPGHVFLFKISRKLTSRNGCGLDVSLSDVPKNEAFKLDKDLGES